MSALPYHAALLALGLCWRLVWLTCGGIGILLEMLCYSCGCWSWIRRGFEGGLYEL